MIVTFADGSTEPYEDTVYRSGGEGETYRSHDRRHLVKFYHDQSQPQQVQQRLDALITQYNPTQDIAAWQEYFAWPDACAIAADGAARIGVRMRFVDTLRSMEAYVFGKSFRKLPPEARGWFIGRMAVAIRLASAAHRLAMKGLCYPDFSDRNVLVDPFDGRMVLIDCDSLAVPGKLDATVEGSDWYRAPEIVAHQSATPSNLTDRHNLAVLLYLWLLNWHPLMGDKVFDKDPTRDDELRFGEAALYIEHPTDATNRALTQRQRSDALGPELRDLFGAAFVQGLHQPSARPQPMQWVEALNRAFDRLVPCANPECDWKTFVVSPGVVPRCPRCGTRLRRPATLPFLRLQAHWGSRDPEEYAAPTAHDPLLVGWHGRGVFPWRTDSRISSLPSGDAVAGPRAPVARFLYDSSATRWLLHNLSLPELQTRVAGAAEWTVHPVGSLIALMPDLVIQFGAAPHAYRATVTLMEVA